MALCATFFYLLPPYPKLTLWSRAIFQVRQALSRFFWAHLLGKSTSNNHRVTSLCEGRFSECRGCHNRAPMIDKFVASAQAALADIPDGATIMIGGFGGAGMPVALIDALIAQGARNLTIVNNNAGNADT